MRRLPHTRRFARLTLLLAIFLIAHTASSAPFFNKKGNGEKSDTKSAQPRSQEDEDALALAAFLIQGGDVDRALTVLDALDAHGEGLDRARYLRLRGHALLRLKRYDEAYRSLDAAVHAGTKGHDVLHERVRAAHGASLHDETVRALDDMGSRWRDDAVLTRIRARALLALGHDALALATLQGARARFADVQAKEVRALALELVGVLAARGLFVEATEVAHAIIPVQNVDESLAMLDALLASEHARTASSMSLVIATAEFVRVRHPDDVRVSQVLARAYADVDKPLSGALVLEPFARRDRARATDVAELYRRAGELESALLWNASAEDGSEKLRQRFSILIDARRYEEACALAPRLKARGLIDDADVEYALGFASFATGQLDEAERTLLRIDDPRRFADATALVASIASCRKDVRTCP